MRTWLLLLAALAACSPAADVVAVSIVEVGPSPAQTGGPDVVLRWELDADGPAYYAVTVGPDERVVASGRVTASGSYETAIAPLNLDPCANQVVLSAVVEGGTSDADSTQLLLCPAIGCRGCEGAADADADVDADVDADSDSDADTTCGGRDFPNGGSCDPLSSWCCGPDETCRPDWSNDWIESCETGVGWQRESESCTDSSECMQGLVCFGPEEWLLECASYCLLEAGRCTRGRVCYHFSFGDASYCPTYGICGPPDWT
jgi:hypothetical protein